MPDTRICTICSQPRPIWLERGCLTCAARDPLDLSGPEPDDSGHDPDRTDCPCRRCRWHGGRERSGIPDAARRDAAQLLALLELLDECCPDPNVRREAKVRAVVVALHGGRMPLATAHPLSQLADQVNAETRELVARERIMAGRHPVTGKRWAECTLDEITAESRAAHARGEHTPVPGGGCPLCVDSGLAAGRATLGALR